MRPVTIPPKPSTDNPKFHYQSAIEAAMKPNDLAD